MHASRVTMVAALRWSRVALCWRMRKRTFPAPSPLTLVHCVRLTAQMNAALASLISRELLPRLFPLHTHLKMQSNEYPSISEGHSIEAAHGNQEPENSRSKAKRVSFGADDTPRDSTSDQTEKSWRKDESILNTLEKLLENQEDKSELMAQESLLNQKQAEIKSAKNTKDRIEAARASLNESLDKLAANETVDSPIDELMERQKDTVDRCIKLAEGILDRQKLLADGLSSFFTRTQKRLDANLTLHSKINRLYKTLYETNITERSICPVIAHHVDSRIATLERHIDARRNRLETLEDSFQVFE